MEENNNPPITPTSALSCHIAYPMAHLFPLLLAWIWGPELPPQGSLLFQKLSLTSSHGNSPLLINTKECNGSINTTCTTPDEGEEIDARGNGAEEEGEVRGHISCRG